VTTTENDNLTRNYGTWKNRRKVIFLTLIFNAALIGYLTVYGDGASRLHETIATGSFSLTTLIILGYVFGAVVDHKFKNDKNVPIV